MAIDIPCGHFYDRNKEKHQIGTDYPLYTVIKGE